ncbi:hypothetical protein [Mycobacterium sp.]|uniref:hypothetical protein n=1 Tax=Mycobacterium sp. TaxID=1785 RepID=UPI003BAA5F8F
MTGPDVRWSAATEEASWVKPRLSPFGADRVDSVIPGGFAAYARLLHPVWRCTPNQNEHLVRWREVAAWSGTALQRTTQFPDIALPRQAPAETAPWDSQGPGEGSLPADDAAVLVELLAAHTPDLQQCWFCVWDGYGWDRVVSVSATTGPAPPPGPTLLPDPIPEWVRSGPRVRLPQREYFLYTGTVHAALTFIEDPGQTPNLWWPQHHGWCVASEIDLPWTYLGGPAPLIEAVLADPRLEALPARPEDPIQLRTPSWLDTLIADAAAKLFEDCTATVTTWCGSVHASLTRPTADTDGWLRISCDVANQFRSSGTALTFQPDNALLDQLHQALTIFITGLVNN